MRTEGTFEVETIRRAINFPKENCFRVSGHVIANDGDMFAKADNFDLYVSIPADGSCPLKIGQKLRVVVEEIVP